MCTPADNDDDAAAAVDGGVVTILISHCIKRGFHQLVAFDTCELCSNQQVNHFVFSHLDIGHKTSVLS